MKRNFRGITAAEADRISAGFTSYAGSFYTGEKEHDDAIRLKARHTMRVADEILDISQSQRLLQYQCRTARVIAVLHDIGRFPQYARHGHFIDVKSEDHAALGCRVIGETGILAGIDSRTKELIEQTVAHHNKSNISAGDDEDFLLFLKMVRDADKIDIWRVVTDHYRGINTHGAILAGLPDTPEISDTILEDVIQRKTIRFSDVRTLNDFKVLQIGWVFDINFQRSFEIIRDRNYLELLRRSLPDTPEVSQAVNAANQHVSQHLRRVGRADKHFPV